MHSVTYNRNLGLVLDSSLSPSLLSLFPFHSQAQLLSSGPLVASFQVLAISYPDCHNRSLTSLRPCCFKSGLYKCDLLTLLLKPLGGSILSSEQDPKLLVQYNMPSWLTVTLCAGFLISLPPIPKSYPPVQCRCPDIPCSCHLCFLTLLHPPERSTHLLSFLSAEPGLLHLCSDVTSPNDSRKPSLTFIPGLQSCSPSWVLPKVLYTTSPSD